MSGASAFNCVLIFHLLCLHFEINFLSQHCEYANKYIFLFSFGQTRPKSWFLDHFKVR